VRTLNEVAPYDWAHLLDERAKAISTHAPMGGIERGGWKLVYTDQPNLFTQAIEKVAKFADFSYSLGFTVQQDGRLSDVAVGSPAYQAGLGPGMRLVAINRRKWSPDLVHVAVKAAESSNQPIELLVENAQFFSTYPVDYHDGEKNPHLERVSDQPDILGDILKPIRE
jgi:predicted metalloprotease with PDZ domain